MTKPRKHHYSRIRFTKSRRKGAKNHEGKYLSSIRRPGDHKQVASKSFDSESEAELWAANYIADLHRGIERGFDSDSDPRTTIHDLIHQFEKANPLPASPTQSQRQRRNQVAWWDSRVGDIQIVHLTSDQISEQLDTYYAEPCQLFDRSTGKLRTTNRKRSPAARNRQFAALKSVISWARKKRLIGEHVTDLMAEIDMLPEDNERDRHLTRAQLVQILELAEKSTYPRMRVFLMGMIYTGARKNEWRKMSWQQINLKQRTATLETSKNGDARALSLPTDLVAELELLHAADLTAEIESMRAAGKSEFELKKRRKDGASGLIFPALTDPAKPFDHRRPWKKILQAMNLNHPVGHPQYCRLHDIRHSAASLMLSEGYSLDQIGKILGHRSRAATERYARLDISKQQQITDEVFKGMGGK